MKPYNSRARIILDIAIQVLFYVSLIAGLWAISLLIS